MITLKTISNTSKMIVFVSSIIFLIGAIAEGATPHNHVGIVGGENATLGQFPFIVSLKTRGCSTPNSTDSLHLCTGTIISPNYILTAAHCVNKQNGKWPILKIVAGLLDIEGGDESHLQEVGIESIVVHPDYDPTNEQFWMMSPNDLAVVKLNKSLTFNEMVGSIALPEEGAELEDDADVQFVGWGEQVCWQKTQARLKYTNYTVINYETCYLACLEVLYGNEKLVTVDEKLSLCTGPLTNGSRYNVAGDAGGPVIKDGIAYGIYSWVFSYNSHMNPPESQGPSGIFAKLSSYITWIKENVDDL